MATDEWREFTTSAGVRVLYGPFPGNLFWDIQGRALRDHPDPEPPKKEIETAFENEMVDDLEDPEYKRALQAAQLARFNLLGEACLEFCVEVPEWDERWGAVCDRLADKYVSDPPPEEKSQRVAWFLAKYALRTTGDWKLIRKIQRFSQVEDEEVARRVEFFRGEVAGAADPGGDAPGADEA